MNPIRKGRALTLVLTHSGSNEVLKSAIDKAEVGDREKMDAIKRLAGFAKVMQQGF